MSVVDRFLKAIARETNPRVLAQAYASLSVMTAEAYRQQKYAVADDLLQVARAVDERVKELLERE